MTLRRSKGLSRTGSLKPRKPRPRKCAAKSCGERFQPFQHGQKVCSPGCALEWGREQKAKIAEKERAERKRRTKAELEALKPPGQKLREATKRAQKAFNAFIRERDRGRPCISCGTLSPGGDPRGGLWDCGHYRTVGAAPELRFDEDNAHRQCVACNRDRSGHVVEYRIRLIERIGQERVDRLEGPHESKRYTAEEMDRIAAHYRERTRELKRAREAA
jgi:hypothetical protein